ncbi:unnamed protein product (macronuclear) [Paramecium tetraurelia]|uniref:Uncharacterized protein n=1 Tax=Paramecium tetraurelia TaxID=5888 RepID=A0BL73_PARTE|nr:uncharacterized protein GSPATT00029922001 [Paramecium tetraurelia]CAK59290.1 unnamed protein product [Paramecium tetraurelia]|eukprot:XP_001426688.1 hypothetical protein (macronuclear) [Paramecium tetraurelia strain d4-2]
MLETLSREVDDNELLNSLQAVNRNYYNCLIRLKNPSRPRSIQVKLTKFCQHQELLIIYISSNKKSLGMRMKLPNLMEAWGDSPEETVKQRQKELDTCESGINAKIEEAKEFRNHVSEQIIHNESRQARFLEQKDLVAQLIVEYQNAFNKIGETYKIRIDDYVEDGVFDKTVDFDKRSLTDLYGDKENNFEQYVDDLVSGVATPVEVPEVEEVPEPQSVFVGGSESGSESEGEEAETTEDVEETVTQGTEESATEEVTTQETVETTTQPEVETKSEETNYFEQGEVQQSV